MREIERDLLGLLAELPLADRLELASYSQWSERAVYQRLGDLERTGLIESLSHASDLIRPTRRFLLTTGGIAQLALDQGQSREAVLRHSPVSERWRQTLLRRLDSVAVIYRLGSAVAQLEGRPRLRWYRSQPPDAAFALADGRSLAVLCWGRTADRTAVSIRMRRLREGAPYSGALLLVPDEVRFRQARRLIRGMPFICFIALERDAASGSAEARIWRAPSGAAVVSLSEVLNNIRTEGQWAVERAPERNVAPRPLAAETGTREPDWMLPARLKPAEKRTLDLVGDWPWINADHLGSLLGVARRRVSQLTADLERRELLTARRIEGKRRFVLSDRGLALLAHRDRASVGAARKRWSASPLDPDAPVGWRNLRGGRTRQLLRNLIHTESVHGFLAALSEQARSAGRRVIQLDPPHRASRYFRFDDRLHSIQPDAFGVLRHHRREQPFFLEWERRAIRPSTMARRLAPYLRYYSSKRPLEDHGAIPLVFVVFEDELAADHFLRIARQEQQPSGVEVPLLVSDSESLAREGYLGPAWRETDGLSAGPAFA
ncbi:MAG: replication-relaxation family protein [Chloroflexota bacterium]|nr:replication-relaxation family protein [Chloroflexota bacterium]